MTGKVPEEQIACYVYLLKGVGMIIRNNGQNLKSTPTPITLFVREKVSWPKAAFLV